MVGALVAAASLAGLLVNRDLSRAGFGPRHRLQWAFFADTVILWLPAEGRTQSDTIESLAYTCQLLLARAFWLNIPLRGAISFGECIVSQDPVYYLGYPVLEAHEWEQKQEWAGAVLAPSASVLLPAECMRTVTHQVPLKDGPSELRTIDWPFCSDGPRLKRIVDGRLQDGPEPDWGMCFGPFQDARVLAKRNATEEFFRFRDQNIRGMGVIVSEDGGDISSWRAMYDARKA